MLSNLHLQHSCRNVNGTLDRGSAKQLIQIVIGDRIQAYDITHDLADDFGAICGCRRPRESDSLVTK
ncbi:MAG: hypothetical protein NTV80_04240 [Verrucomicrobia bacterium]|nr:hypothetical protein [Verrucomicrobiota bacterium]